jgi:uncharacterized coiled-coil protein SlyX
MIMDFAQLLFAVTTGKKPTEANILADLKRMGIPDEQVAADCADQCMSAGPVRIKHKLTEYFLERNKKILQAQEQPQTAEPSNGKSDMVPDPGFRPCDEGSLGHQVLQAFKEAFNEWLVTDHTVSITDLLGDLCGKLDVHHFEYHHNGFQAIAFNEKIAELERQVAEQKEIVARLKSQSANAANFTELNALRNVRNQVIDLLKRNDIIPQHTVYDVNPSAAVNAIAQLVDQLKQYKEGLDKEQQEHRTLKQKLWTLAGAPGSSLGGNDEEEIEEDYGSDLE